MRRQFEQRLRQHIDKYERDQSYGRVDEHIGDRGEVFLGGVGGQKTKQVREKKLGEQVERQDKVAFN